MFKILLKCLIILYITKIIRAQHDHSTPQFIASVSNVFVGEPLDSTFTKVGDKLYYFGQSKVSWYKALQICRSLGGNLASVNSKNDLENLSKYLRSNFELRTWWLSGSDLETEGDFFWYSTGRRIEYAEWSNNQPDNHNDEEHCVHLKYDNPRYKMYDGKCEWKLYYICESNLKTIILNVS